MTAVLDIPLPLFMHDDAPRARESDLVTSHEAADSNDVHGSRACVIRLLQWKGALADHELVALHDEHETGFGMPNYTAQRLRSARSELVELGQVEVVPGEYRKTDKNRRAQVWRIKTEEAR